MEQNLPHTWDPHIVLASLFSPAHAKIYQNLYKEYEEEIAKWIHLHQFSPFAYYSFQQTWASLAKKLKQGYLVASSRDMLLDRQLQQLQKHYSNADFSTMLLKGAALNKSVYPKTGLRDMGDIDILVPPSSVENSIKKLQALPQYRYQPKPKNVILKAKESDEYQFESQRQGDRLIELHGSAFPGWWLKYISNVEEDTLWERAISPQELHPFSILAPEDQIIHLAGHTAVNHQFGMNLLHSLIDIAIVIQKYDIDWQIVIDRAKQWRLATVTWINLRLLCNLFSFALPQHIDSDLAPKKWTQKWLLSILNPQSIFQKTDFHRTYQRYLLLLLLIDNPSYVGRLLYKMTLHKIRLIKEYRL